MITFQLQSQITRYNYTIRLKAPNSTNEQQPIYFILDGSWYYPYIEAMVDRQSPNAAKTKISDAWIVSIEHGEDIRERRFYDFTPSAKSYEYPERFKTAPIRQHGGAEDFHLFLKNELLPTLKKYQLPSTKRILFGHSLSGLYASYESLLEDCLFDAAIAISPSIWWNKHQLLDIQKRSIKQIPLYIAVGGEEGHMVDDAKVYHEKIAKSKLYIAVDENHASIVPTVMSRAFRYFY